MDTTYFWRKYGIMVFRDWKMKENLLRKEVKWETKGDYVLWIKELQSKWREIEAIVCDGKRWLLVWFPGIPTQMCIFHQQQIIRRYITRSPKLEANIEFKELSSMIGKARKETMKIWLEDRYRKHEKFLKERNDKWKIVHTRTMKAYKSVKRNLEYLYTYEEYKGKIEIPKTTNSLESVFWHMKQKIWIHRGLKKRRKLRLIDDFL